ncbi:MAG TPA: VOC family protein [Candidatus Sulfotelmatobacter sp.]
MSVKPIPEGYHTLTPFLTVRDAVRAIEFYKQAFGAQERGVMKGPDGKVMHAELKIGDSVIMLSDEWPEFGALSPLGSGGAGMGLHIYIDGVDAAFDRAVKAGARVDMPVSDQFWGDRYGKLTDPFGHKWSIATHTKDMSADEMKRNMDEAMAKMQPPEKMQKTA